jgi:hypothetical protein
MATIVSSRFTEIIHLENFWNCELKDRLPATLANENHPHSALKSLPDTRYTSQTRLDTQLPQCPITQPPFRMGLAGENRFR